MKKLLFSFLILIGITSCTVTPGYYSSSYDYDYNPRPVVTVVTPTPFVPNPYLYRPTRFWYGGFYRPSYITPRPRTIVINNYSNYNNNHNHHSGPRGGRRK